MFYLQGYKGDIREAWPIYRRPPASSVDPNDFRRFKIQMSALMWRDDHSPEPFQYSVNWMYFPLNYGIVQL